MIRPSLYVALVHYPVVNKHGEVMTTSVTNLDIHDISRSSRTFGVQGYFLVTPIELQHQLLSRILGHWEGPGGQDYNPDRHEALKLATPVRSLDEAFGKIAEAEGAVPLIAVTAAKFGQDEDSMAALIEKARSLKRPVCLCFGTGHGLAQEVLERAEVKLTGLSGLAEDGYNHLSVRSAVAIYLDRWAQSL